MDDLEKIEKDMQEKINKLIAERDRIDKILTKFGHIGVTTTGGRRPGRPKAQHVEPAEGVSAPK